ncbi:ATP-binding protein [Streptomyces alkaliterrae]|uniref:ATP-binding protein n=1 Tax=Streptomyces alkaliterrae TaxID=2213162 RepID=A0A5P0YJ35_9ACTN|nr:ATP-binding protein [Streptomyces alkaliterrae]MBB1251827.1 ATP-binding protein [Streptomyces alkaliterrae]MBB1259539.1 ATP-binding protein [Streptomyces alkaliterrae]MQS00335.1 ATP-binding protein [Streptomyces alkaliterrae]
MDDLCDGYGANGSRTDAAAPEPLGTMTLRPVPESVPTARRWFRKLLEPHAPHGSPRWSRALEDSLLMMSELVTNAVLHPRAQNSRWRVRVEWWREGTRLRVTVHSPGPPEAVRMRAATEDATGGRGLLLVDALASRWQVATGRYGGTAVTFEVDDAWPATEDG